jgi:hypothetical protein
MPSSLSASTLPDASTLLAASSVIPCDLVDIKK